MLPEKAIGQRVTFNKYRKEAAPYFLGQPLFAQPKNGSQAFAQVAFLIVIAVSVLMTAPRE